MTTELNKFESLKIKLLDVGLVIPGTLRETYHRCGKDYCLCMKSEEHRHGPYFLWDRRVRGKLAAKSIPKEDVALYKEWIQNRKKMNEIVKKMIECGNKYATAKQDIIKSD
jgi:hypothetical protein